MTNKEAIKILQQNKPVANTRLCGIELCEAVDVAIVALQEVDKEKYNFNSLNKEDFIKALRGWNTGICSTCPAEKYCGRYITECTKRFSDWLFEEAKNEDLKND